MIANKQQNSTQEKIQKKKRKIFSLRTIAFAIAALLFGYSVYTVNAQNLVGDKMPMPFGIGASIVLSGSMEPELSVDDMIVIRATKEVEVGNIAVFQSGSSLVVHRVISVNGDTVCTQGDANNTADPPITKDRIKGVLVFSVPKIGVIVEFLRQPVVMVLMAVIIVWLSELAYKKEKQADTDELSDIKREIDELKKSAAKPDEKPENPDEERTAEETKN